MSPTRERSHFVDLQSDPPEQDQESPFTSLLEDIHMYPAQDNAFFSCSYAEAGSLAATHGQEIGSNGDREMEEGLDESLAGLELNGNDDLSNILGRTNNIGMNADQSQRIPETIDPTLTSGVAYKRTSGAHTILTPSQPPNSPENWSYLVPWREGSSANLLSPSNTPYRSSAATHSQYSDSAWETVPPSPSGDDYDSRSMPNGNSASMQSYNHPRTGIWTIEDTHGRARNYPTVTGMGHNNGISSTMTRSLAQALEQMFANADAATPFGTGSYSNGGTLPHNSSYGAVGMPRSAAPSFTPTSISAGPVPQFYQPPINSRSGVSVVVDSTVDLGASTTQQSLEFERSPYQLGSNRSSGSNIAPRITLDTPQLSATMLPATRSMGPPSAAPSPSPSADTSIGVVVRCTHRGCQARFTGVAWKDSLRRHTKDKHGRNSKPTCPVCGMVFQSGRPDNLKRHILAKHPDYPLPPSRNARTRRSAPRRRR